VDSKTGRLNGDCRKLSIKVDANKYRDDKQKINGMRRLSFHGMAVDESLVSERTSYNLMRSVGIAAPRASHGELYINGNFDGIYAMVQEVNEELMEKSFKEDNLDGEGAIYKDLMFMESQLNEQWLEEHLQGGVAAHSHMLMVGNAIQNAREGDCSVLKEHFDTDAIVNVTAFNELIGQSDDWRYLHNFFWCSPKTSTFTDNLAVAPLTPCLRHLYAMFTPC
jgi:spore coat protein CotH